MAVTGTVTFHDGRAINLLLHYRKVVVEFGIPILFQTMCEQRNMEGNAEMTQANEVYEHKIVLLWINNKFFL